MFKKLMIGVMAAVLFVGLLPVNKGFAYVGGLLHGKPIHYGTNPSSSSGTTNLATDGDMISKYYLAYNSPSSDTLFYIFDSEQSISSYQIQSNGSVGDLKLSFYDSADLLISPPIDVVNDGTKRNITTVNGVKKVVLHNNSIGYRDIFEFDVFGTEQPVYTGNKYIYGTDFTITNGIADITNPEKLFDDYASTYATIGYAKTVTYEFKNEVTIKDLLTIGPQMSFTFYDSNGNQLYSDAPSSNIGATTARITPVMKNGIKKITMRNPSGNPANHYYTAFTYDRQYFPVTDLKATPGERDISLSWKNPVDSTFTGTKILLNGSQVKTTGATATSATITGVSPETDYEIRVIPTYSDGGQGAAATVTTKTLVEVIKDVLETSVKTDYNRVDLSWKIPQQYGFNHVNIYRKVVVEEPGIFESLFLGSIVSAAAEEDKIFETNGTYFNDLTVEPETTYEYTLTTQTVEGKESEGVIVEATTLEEPIPTVEGENYTVDENGDYIFTWEQPTEGTMKIIVGGKEYSSVDASTGQFLIPKEDMDLTGFGDPDVTLQPVSKYGTEGETKSISENNGILKLPFSINDFVLTGMQLVSLIGSFLLLALAFLLFPKLRKLIVSSFRGNRKGEAETEKTKGFRRFRSDKKEAKEKHEGKEHIEKTDKLQRERQEREKREREAASLAAPKIKEPRAPKERKRDRIRAGKLPRIERAAKEPRAPRERTREAREPRGKRRA